MESTANLRHARVSARKARLVADLVRGKDVGQALDVEVYAFDIHSGSEQFPADARRYGLEFRRQPCPPLSVRVYWREARERVSAV